MIHSIELRNFQSHRHTVLEFDPGVNALVGLSDSGKTAVIRALNWVCNNKPSGADFQSHWGGETSVTITLSDQQQIKRVRYKDKNEYWLNEQCFKAFGQDVPAEIRTVLNVADINIQFQLDTPFLLGNSPGEVAQYLNQVVRLDGIDRAAQGIRKLLSAVQQAVKTEENRIAEVSAQLEQFADLSSFESELLHVEALFTQQNLLRVRRTGVQQLTDKACTQQQIIAKHRGVASDYPIVIQALEALDTQQKAARRSIALLQIRSTVNNHQGTLQCTKAVLAAEKLFEQARAIDKRVQELIGQEKAILAARAKVKEHQDRLFAAQQLETQLSTQLKAQMPNVCPLCGQEV